MQIAQKCIRFNNLFAISVVGATSGRPPFIRFTDETENAFLQKKNACFHTDVHS